MPSPPPSPIAIDTMPTGWGGKGESSEMGLEAGTAAGSSHGCGEPPHPLDRVLSRPTTHTFAPIRVSLGKGGGMARCFSG